MGDTSGREGERPGLPADDEVVSAELDGNTTTANHADEADDGSPDEVRVEDLP